MSCEKNAVKCRAASVASGISTLGSRAGNAAGAVAAKANLFPQQIDAAMSKADLAVDRLGQRFASVTNAAVNMTENKETKRKVGAVLAAGGTIAKLTPVGSLIKRNVATQKTASTAITLAGPVMGATLGLPSSSRKQTFLKLATAKMIGKALPPVAMAHVVVKTADITTSALGAAAGAVSKTGEAGEVTQEKKKFFGLIKSQQKTALWRSSLTSTINRADVLVSPKNISSSKGVMFEASGKTWHSGTVQVQLPASGKKRTITHLQSMSLPSKHCYFDRPVSGKQAVGIATGKIKAQDVAGYQGQVSQLESLSMPIAQLKHTLIKAKLHWPAGDTEK